MGELVEPLGGRAVSAQLVELSILGGELLLERGRARLERLVIVAVGGIALGVAIAGRGAVSSALTSHEVGGLAIPTCYFRGHGEFRALPWLKDSQAMVRQMTAVTCLGGTTQIARVLRHAVAEAGKVARLPLGAPIRSDGAEPIGVVVCTRLHPAQDIAAAGARLGEICAVFAALLAIGRPTMALGARP